MDHERANGPKGLGICIPKDEGYRTCAECGADCMPQATVVGGLGIRVAFVCLAHGVHSFLDPFESER